MNIREAWLYLKKYGGWDFLNKHWWALHTDNVLYALNADKLPIRHLYCR